MQDPLAKGLARDSMLFYKFEKLFRRMPDHVNETIPILRADFFSTAPGTRLCKMQRISKIGVSNTDYDCVC